MLHVFDSARVLFQCFKILTHVEPVFLCINSVDLIHLEVEFLSGNVWILFCNRCIEVSFSNNLVVSPFLLRSIDVYSFCTNFSVYSQFGLLYHFLALRVIDEEYKLSVTLLYSNITRKVSAYCARTSFLTKSSLCFSCLFLSYALFCWWVTSSDDNIFSSSINNCSFW